MVFGAMIGKVKERTWRERHNRLRETYVRLKNLDPENDLLHLMDLQDGSKLGMYAYHLGEEMVKRYPIDQKERESFVGGFDPTPNRTFESSGDGFLGIERYIMDLEREVGRLSP